MSITDIMITRVLLTALVATLLAGCTPPLLDPQIKSLVVQTAHIPFSGKPDSSATAGRRPGMRVNSAAVYQGEDCDWQTPSGATVSAPVSLVSHHASQHSVASPVASQPRTLDGADIRALIWNIQKASNDGWQEDLSSFSQDKDLLLLQEAVLTESFVQQVPHPFWTFADGYQASSGPTGVMTASAIEPLQSCALQEIEPWLGTPKAISLNQYAIAGSDDTLIVVNIHSINFSWELSRYIAQLDAAVYHLRHHQGPILFAGDFNTWRQARSNVVDSALQELGLEQVTFKQDVRKRIFDYPLDRIYTRGLQVSEASSLEVSSSDHNPMFIRLHLLPKRI